MAWQTGMSTSFSQKKAKILDALGVPDDSYTDLSPKGSVDVGIRDLIDDINAVQGLVTTSSCAGRISVFLEGNKKPKSTASKENAQATATPGGKGGGRWLFVTHDPISTAEPVDCHAQFQLQTVENAVMPDDASLVHFKFEPMILHILAASLVQANSVLMAANQAGFRESGAMGLTAAKDGSTSPMVAVRSAGLSFDSIIGYQADNGRLVSLVDEQYLRALVKIANQRFETNSARIQRFRDHLLKDIRPAKRAVAASTGPLE